MAAGSQLEISAKNKKKEDMLVSILPKSWLKIMRILRITIVANLHPAYYTPGAVLSIPVRVAQ